MVVISSVIVVISAVSLYEYYSARNWQQVTSASRNDVVFEKRNQKYGAYIIRRDYDKRVLLILFSFISSIGLAYGSFLYFSDPVSNNMPDDPGSDPIPYVITPVELKKKEEPKQEIDKPKQKSVLTHEFRELIVVDKPVDTTQISIDPNINIGIRTIPGDSTGTPGIGIPDGRIITITPVSPLEEFPDIDAAFPGGEKARQSFIIDETMFPDEAFDFGGKCYLRFVVNTEGEISSVKVERGVPNCSTCDKEAIRVVKAMPIWKPAEKNGKKVTSYFRMVINFQGKE